MIKNILPSGALHVPSIWALVAAIARSLARAARVDSFHLCRLGCEESKRARERDSERKRECESEKKSETQRERTHRRSFVNTTRLLTIYRIVPQDCCETVRHSERKRASKRERARESGRKRVNDTHPCCFCNRRHRHRHRHCHR